MSPSTGVEVLANPMRGRGDPPPARDPSVRQFHRRFPDYATSPLVDLPRLAEASGIGRLLVKDESNRLGLPAFKMLGASWASYRALSERLGQEPEWSTFEELATELKALGPMSLSTATDGNHGRAVASFAAPHRARRPHLRARRDEPGPNRGHPLGRGDLRGRQRHLRGCRRPGGRGGGGRLPGHLRHVVAGIRDGPRWVIDGYATIFDELDEQLAAIGRRHARRRGHPDRRGCLRRGRRTLVPGGDATGRPTGPDTHVSLIGVEPTTAACLYHSIEAGEMIEVAGPHHSIMAGLNCGRPSPVAWPTVSYSYDWFTAIDDDVARLGMRELAADGIVSGETGAAATGAILALTANGASIDAGELGLHPDATVVAISTEGATDPAEYERIVGHPPTAERRRDTAVTHDGGGPVGAPVGDA